MMSAYSAASHGHGHPRILRRLRRRRSALPCPRAPTTATARAVSRRVARTDRFDAALPMNTGAEAVETAPRRAPPGGRVKGMFATAPIIVVAGTSRPHHDRHLLLHGRITATASGPFTPGFRPVPFGDLARSSVHHTRDGSGADRADPGRGRDHAAGGLSRGCASATRTRCCSSSTRCSRPGRTGPVCLPARGHPPGRAGPGKALGGGVLPVSAFVGKRRLMDVFTPGSHG